MRHTHAQVATRDIVPRKRNWPRSGSWLFFRPNSLKETSDHQKRNKR
jgi:hypothetical protein